MIYTSQYHQQFDIISDLIHKNLIRKGFILTQDHNLFAYDFIKNKIIYRLVWTGKNWFYRRNEKIYNCKNLEILFISFLLDKNGKNI